MSKPTLTYSGESLFSAGIGQAVIARFKNDGRIEIGAFPIPYHGSHGFHIR